MSSDAGKPVLRKKRNGTAWKVQARAVRNQQHDSPAIVSDTTLHVLAVFLLFAPLTGHILASTYGLNAIAGPLIGFLVAWVGLFFLAFTGKPTRARMMWMVRFCYLFCFMAVLATVLPFFLLKTGGGANPAGDATAVKVDTISRETKADSVFSEIKGFVQLHMMGDNAISIAVGCRKADEKNEDSKPQYAVDCAESGFQWVFHIGGTLHTVADAAEQSPKNRAGGDGFLITNGAPIAGLRHANFSEKDRVVAGDRGAARSPVSGDTLRDNCRDAAKRYYIEGGLIFPLHLVVISLVGGAVSLTRRVPEIQCHASAEDSIQDNIRRRKDLIQQIMQFVSAPFVAMIAFALIEPSSSAMAVGVAFLSGFASEYVLVTIAGVFETLKPQPVLRAA